MAPLRLFYIISLCCLAFMNGCKQPPHDISTSGVPPNHLGPDYASCFRIIEQEGQLKVQIFNPWDRSIFMQEITILDDAIVFENGISVPRPVESMVALSSTQWSAFEKLDALSHIVGISESSFVRSEAMKKQLQDGVTTDVGRHGAYKPELIVNLQPQLILYAPEAGGTPAVLTKTNIPVLLWPDYFETDPLGRAEWIKLAGILAGKEAEAEVLFASIADAYNHYREMLVDLTEKPTIFADKEFSGHWYVPGGKSYMATLFAHAGSEYVWADNNSTASFALDMESIIARAWNADFWRIAHAASDSYSLRMLQQENPVYAGFKSFRNNHVIFCNTAASSYFEKGPFEPHLILADLIYFLHPGLLTEYEPVYHQQLE